MSLNIGLDLGSTVIKMVLLNNRELVWRGQRATAPGQEKLGRELIDQAMREYGLNQEALAGIAATGYGKSLFVQAGYSVDEISANARGVFQLSDGQARTIINIGGQDLKVIRLSERGQVLDFKMNDKCAAGTGRFFELAARLLDTPLADFGAMSARASQALELNSTCVVFAESEIVSLMARGVPKENIIKGLHYSVARRVAGLLRIECGDIYLDGGPALNQGLMEALEDELMVPINVLEQPQYSVAYGAALGLPL